MSVTIQTIRAEARTPNLNEFFVPSILQFDLNKTSEDREEKVAAGDLTRHQNGDKISTKKYVSNLTVTTARDEEVSDMSPRRKSKSSNCKEQSSFLLQPFLKPVDPHIESNKENPVLKALFGGRSPPGLSPWTYVTKTSINNCHPFKKTELSHDLTTDDTPIEIPKSLLKKPSGVRKRSTKRETTLGSNTNVLKEIQLDSDGSSQTSVSLSPSGSSQNIPSATIIKVQKFQESSLLNKRKKITSQVALPTAKPRLPYVNSERLIQLRTLVDNAVKNHKIYSMTGCYNSVRNALKQRGWIEKIDSDVKGRRRINKFEEIGLYDAAFQFVQKNETVAAMKLAIQTHSGFAHNDQIRYTGQGEAEIMNRMLRNVTEDLCWLSRPFPYYCYKDFDKFEMINRLPRAYFSNKVGLCNSLQQIQWFYESGVCSTQFPRTYNTSVKDELQAFKDDFRLTACIGLLKWFIQTYKNGGESAVRSNDGKVEMSLIEFALRRCAEYVKTKQHEDIDILESPIVWEYQWDNFLTQYYKVVNDGQILKDNKEGITIKAIVSNVQSMLNILKPHWSQYDIDGYQNFWIVKPGGRCCGAGIVIKNNLDQILAIANPNSLKETRYVVQKYIERPLLIYNTKFDIRQWFLVTNVYPLTVWMYKESYLRFCSQPFTLKNTHESIHLCNNAVQRKYKNGKRDRGLPDENMWDCYTFQTYLKAVGHPDIWEKHIYPGMKESFIGALLASQDSMERKKNCFELYGADFMISDTLTDGPWLIEINSNPAMDSSTSVTARMCPQVLEDIIKVVIDRRENKNAPTGAFEMVYKQNCPPIPPYLGMSLCIKGKKAYKANGDGRSISRKSKSKNSTESLLYTDSEEESTGQETVSMENSSDSTKKDNNSSDEGHSSPKFCVDKQSRIKNDRGIKRRKIDWVRKNIEDLKSIHSVKQPKTSIRSASTKEAPRRPVTPDAKKLKKTDDILDVFGKMEVKQFLTEVLKIKTEPAEDEKTEHCKSDVSEKPKQYTDANTAAEVINSNSKDIKNIPNKAVKGNQQSIQDKETLWNEFVDDIKETGFRIYSKISAKSCPNFDVTFEKELQRVDEKLEQKSKKSEESMESFFSATSCGSRCTSKTSLEYFRDWRSKISDTRRSCEDMLAKLQLFQEENSKTKFQDALKKTIKSEVEFIKRIKQLRKNVNGQKGIYKKTKMEECRLQKNLDCDEVLCLAINSDTGAVKGINDSLIKMKQWNRPSLPQGPKKN